MLKKVLTTADGARGSFPIQAMPLRKDFVNLVTPAEITNPVLVYCVLDGTITITWEDATTSDITMVEGNTFAIDGASLLTIGTATVHAVGESVA